MGKQVENGKIKVLVVYKQAQDLHERLEDLMKEEEYYVQFIDERTFDVKNLLPITPDVILLPLTLEEGKSFLIARHIRERGLQTKLLLCSNTNLTEQELVTVFDGLIRRDGIEVPLLKNKIQQLLKQAPRFGYNEAQFSHNIASVIIHEGAFGPNNAHGEKSIFDIVFNKKETNYFLRSYLFIVLITMICGLYSFADAVYKQLSDTSPKDLTILWLTIIPSIAAIIFAVYHHEIETNNFSRKEITMYVVLGLVWMVHISYFVFKNSFCFFG